MRRVVVALIALVLLLNGTPAGADPGADLPGADYAWFRPTRGQLAGLNIVARYLVPAAWGSGKALTAYEAEFLLNQGLVVVLNFEWSPTGARGGYPAGVRDARAAELARVEVGAPPTVVYFSADWNVQPSEIPVVLSYLSGVADTLGRGRTGLYGGYRVVHAALSAGYRWAWQTYAWSSGRWDPRAQFRQTANGALWNGQGDRDRSTAADVGGWWIGGSFPIRGGDQSRPRYVPPAPAPLAVFYTVRRGDTLSSIARRYGTTWQRLAALNHLAHPSVIAPGRLLRVTAGDRPGPAPVPSPARTYRVRRGDTLSSIARRYGTTWQRLAALNHLAHPSRLYVGRLLRLRR